MALNPQHEPSSYENLTDREQNSIVAPTASWSESFAKKVVAEDYSRASSYRFQNHDWRWGNADELYLGWVPQKYWEGTKIPRANISVRTAYEQIESMMPRVMSTLFGDNPWFEANQIGRKTTAEAARISRDVILAQLHQCRIRKVMRLVLKSAYTYGNGIMEACWYYCKQERMKMVPRFEPVRKSIRDPFTGQSFPVSTGEYTRVIDEIIEEEFENRPILKPVSLKHFYVDPNCPTPDPKDARYTIVRSLMTVDELSELRDIEGFDIPDNATLIMLAQQKSSDQGDNTQSYQESARLGSWSPQIDQSLDPAAARIEVLRYTTNKRVVWLANREVVLHNQPNLYGRILQYNAFYTDLVDRFYGLAITDVVEGEQRLQEGILNGRLDEISLALHPPTVVKRGNTTPTYQLRVRPGATNYSDDPKNDLIRQYPTNITAQAFQEDAASNLRVQKITGLTDLSVLGVSSGNNPGARSATGAGLQGQASTARIQYSIENVESDVIEPMLEDIHLLNQYHLDPNQMIEAVDGTELDPIQVFGANVKFSMRAASRMQSRQGLLQVLPLIMQNIMNPALLEQLMMTGQTVDFAEILQMVLDATGYRNKAQWIRALTEEEQQKLSQATPNPDQIKMAMQDKRFEQMADMQIDKGEMEIAKTILAGQARGNKK